MRFFGDDEEFVGHYGREDDTFIKIHKWHSYRFKYLLKRFRAIEWAGL